MLIRDTLVDRLAEDLVGPSAPNEVLDDRPTDRYLTGILFAQHSGIDPVDDERLALDSAGDGNEDPPEDVDLSSTLKPSSAGVSFAAMSRKGAPAVDITVRCGTYAPVDSPADESKAGGPRGRGRAWQRTDHIVDLPRTVAVNGQVDLTKYGLPNVVLFLKTAPWEDAVLVTVVLVNRRVIPTGAGRAAAEEAALFQVAVECRPAVGTTFPARPSHLAGNDTDAMANRLLYHDVATFAIGHTCSARWQTSEDGRQAAEIGTTWLPSAVVNPVDARGSNHLGSVRDGSGLDALDASTLAASDPATLTSLLKRIPDAYRAWIADQSGRLATLPAVLADQGRRHLATCETCASRMDGAVAYLTVNADARTAFQLAMRAMVRQFEWTNRGGANLQWRPFQLGFLLLALESTVRPDHPERETMDLLWFPTGGGKTEAYLALIAFVLFHRRLHSGLSGQGVGAFMRYTLRLLTTQQFQRATALILACESIRRSSDPAAGRLGEVPFSIGLWVGDEAVANKVENALEALETNGINRPDQVELCPACQTRLLWGPGPARQSVKVTCSGNDCELAGWSRLPIWTVDEDVYRELPSLLIATTDKFAQLLRSIEPGRLLGRNTANRPPDLVIQDELHLISGPLGTLAGLYEMLIDHLCTVDGARPKVIGSTATIRRADDQIRTLFDRKAQLFPPPGLMAGDSCFAVDAPHLPGRRYLAVTTAGRSAKFALQAVLASLLQAAGQLRRDRGDSAVDGYATLVTYFNALRELGGALVLAQDDVPSSIKQLADRRSEAGRDLQSIVELTSRVSQAELKERLSELSIPAGESGMIDLLLATNMISVGVDIRRLGLMVVNGQPKAIAEYIQATSRVGRASDPGLVVAVYNHNKARDRSRYESFATWHQHLYREVEATSVTPLSPRARDRALHVVPVGYGRYEGSPPTLDPSLDFTSLRESVAERARRVDPEEADATVDQLDEIVGRWRDRGSVTFYWNDRAPRKSLLIGAERAAALEGAGRGQTRAWPTPNSMRTVEPGTRLKVVEGLKGPANA